jgi:hypothetical protein
MYPTRVKVPLWPNFHFRFFYDCEECV